VEEFYGKGGICCDWVGYEKEDDAMGFIGKLVSK